LIPDATTETFDDAPDALAAGDAAAEATGTTKRPASSAAPARSLRCG
jgi:hypothetical protein